MQILYIYIGDA